MKTTQETSNAESQAQAQLSSIIEMVKALDGENQEQAQQAHRESIRELCEALKTIADGGTKCRFDTPEKHVAHLQSLAQSTLAKHQPKDL